MTGAKDQMREKKMKNQPRNVIYTSSGRDTGRGQGSQACGWVRGHQPGGHSYSQDLPKYITASSFAKARAAEVNAMLKAVSKPAGSCHIFSALPKHMRRRATAARDCRADCERELRDWPSEVSALQRKRRSSCPETQEPAAGVQSQTEEEQMAGDAYLARQTLPHAEDVELLSAAQTHRKELQSHELPRAAAGFVIFLLFGASGI